MLRRVLLLVCVEVFQPAEVAKTNVGSTVHQGPLQIMNVLFNRNLISGLKKHAANQILVDFLLFFLVFFPQKSSVVFTAHGCFFSAVIISPTNHIDHPSLAQTNCVALFNAGPCWLLISNVVPRTTMSSLS